MDGWREKFFLSFTSWCFRTWPAFWSVASNGQRMLFATVPQWKIFLNELIYTKTIKIFKFEPSTDNFYRSGMYEDISLNQPIYMKLLKCRNSDVAEIFGYIKTAK